MHKLRLILWLAVVLVAGLSLALFVSDDLRRLAGGQSGVEGVAAIGGEFSLVDHTGAPVTHEDLLGRPSVYFFGFTHCPDVCPTTLYEMSGWMQELGDVADRLQFVFVTVDPERDGPEDVARYLGAFDDRIVGLTGTPEQVADMARAWRVYVRKVPLENEAEDAYTVDHTASVYLMDSDGRFFGTIAFGEADDSALAKLRRLSREG
jgi:protein SCO1